MFGEIPEISSDLEWILQSGQANREMLLETLVQDYAEQIYRLTLALFSDPSYARQVTMEIFLRALERTSAYRNSNGVESWLLNIALPIFRKASRKLERFEGVQEAPNEPFKSALHNMPWASRLLLYLRRLLKWDINQISNLLRQPQKAVAAQLEQAEFDLIPHMENSTAPGGLSEYLDNYWSAVKLSDADLADWMTHAQDYALNRLKTPVVSIKIKETAIISTAILIVLIATWLINLWLPDSETTTVAHAQATMAPESALRMMGQPFYYTVLPGEKLEEIAQRMNLTTEHLQILNRLPVGARLFAGQKILVTVGQTAKSGNPPSETFQKTTPMQTKSSAQQPELNSLPPLDKQSSILQIIERSQISQRLWTRLFFEAQSVDYGPQSYLGPARLQRFQTWVEQPNSSLLRTGLLDGVPQETHLITAGKYFRTNHDGGKNVSWWDFESQPLLPVNSLQTLISPNSILETLDPDRLHVAGVDKIAGRAVILVEGNSSTQPSFYRLYLDAQTGIILRQQEYFAPNSTLLSDIMITQIELEPAFDNQNLFDVMRIQPSFFTEDFINPFPEPNQASLSANLAIDLKTRPQEPAEPTPEGFDPSNSPLKFQYPQTLGANSVYSTTAQILAEGYLLGEVKLGAFWQIACQRTNDGKFLAYYLNLPSEDPMASGLHWLNLVDANVVYQAMPEFQIVNSAFSVDGKKLAVFARHSLTGDSGLYLLDYATGSYQLIIALDDAQHITWKPDGEYISLLGKEEQQTEQQWLLIHVPTGFVTSRTVPQAPNETEIGAGPQANDLLPPPAYPAWQWGVDFMNARKGLDACAEPGR